MVATCLVLSVDERNGTTFKAQSCNLIRFFIVHFTLFDFTEACRQHISIGAHERITI